MKFLFYLLIITFLYADNQTAEDILLKTFHRLDGMNYQCKVDSKISGKKKKGKHFEQWKSCLQIVYNFFLQKLFEHAIKKILNFSGPQILA